MLPKLDPQDRLDRRVFDRYVEKGTTLAALAHAGSIYFLMGIAAADKVTRLFEISKDQIQPLCEHLMNPQCE